MGCEKVGFIDLSGYKKSEKNYQSRTENKERGSVTFEAIYAKAEGVIEKNKINPQDFINVYGDGVAIDVLKAQSQKEKFDARLDKNSRECKKYAEVMEAILVDLVNSAEWLGEGAEAMNTSDFDDFESGVDIVTEITKDGGDKKHLGLAMDATFSNEVSDKFRGIKGEIVRGELAELKYFKSNNSEHGLSEIPHVVIGVSLGKIKELGKLWVNGDLDKLRNHPVQYQILEEMIIQLETFEKYALKCGQEKLAIVYRDNCQTIREIKAKKEEILLDTGERDHIFEILKKEMDNFMNDRRR